MAGAGLFDAIPEIHRDAARDAVAATFSGPASAMRPLPGGASGALKYRFEVGERPYVLRIESGRNALRDPDRGYACMRIAADAGIAPPLLRADAATGVALMEFIEPQPLGSYPGGPSALVGDLGRLLARLQETPQFPTFAPYPLVAGGLLSYIRDSGLFGAGVLDRHAEEYDRITAGYPWDEAALVSGHNDMSISNVLFDGERLWLVDWELSFRNDALSDVAHLSHYVAPTAELERELLRRWHGDDPDELVIARFTLMQQLTRLFIGCLVLGVSVGQRTGDTDLNAPTLAAFRTEIVETGLRIEATETLYRYGKVFLAAFLRGLDDPSFEHALAVLS